MAVAISNKCRNNTVVCSIAAALFALSCFVPFHATSLQISSGWGMDVESLKQTYTTKPWINLQYQVPDAVAIEAAAKFNVPSLYYFEWTAPDTSRITNATAGTCNSTIKRFGNTTHCKTIRPDYKEAWAASFKQLETGYIENKTYVGVFLGDENIWDGASIKNLTTITDMIKRDWPEAIIFINEAQDVVNCNFNRLGNPVFGHGECLPSTLDWFGYDYYCTIPGCTDPYGKESGWQVQRDGMQHMLYPKLVRPDQKVVPTTLGFFYRDNKTNATEYQKMDEYCAYNADEFMKWASEDSRLIGMFPFYWASSPTTIGLRDLPKCLAKWKAIGESIVELSSVPMTLKGGGVPLHTQPAQQFICANPVEKVPHEWCRKDRYNA